MKKILALTALIVLLGVAILVPKEIHNSKQVYEKRMTAAINVIKKTLQLSPTISTNLTNVGVYRPAVSQRFGSSSLQVTGVLGLSTDQDGEIIEPFRAEISNKCEGNLNPSCLQVVTLTVKGVALIQAGEVVGRIPLVAPFPPSPVEQRAASTVGGQDGTVPGSKETIAATPAKPAVETEATAKPVTVSKTETKPAATSAGKQRGSETPANDKTSTASPPLRDTKEADASPKTEVPGSKGKAETSSVAAAKTSKPAGEPTESKTEVAPAQNGDIGTELAARYPSAPKPDATSQDVLDSPDQVLQIQIALKKIGYDPGQPDNTLGSKTRSAIHTYQANNGLAPTGEASADLLQHIKSNPVFSQSGTAATGDRNQQVAARGSAQRDQTSSLAADRPQNRIARIQRALRRFGYDPGPIDNLVGQKTRDAILAYQRRNGLEPTGEATIELLQHITGVDTQSNTRP